jgi:hypothetical protein
MATGGSSGRKGAASHENGVRRGNGAPKGRDRYIDAKEIVYFSL